ncbi:NAD(P)-dependent oxidoreductase [Agromyces seonyuensis]|uniref:NAD(P)-dependent oxidoreductase n=1 Tax=Agromyces seonyuensis TaxID=2662446 RepID=UPI001F1945E6|nr:NAD(P)H-binding protein [Agromyces seonyuensis]
MTSNPSSSLRLIVFGGSGRTGRLIVDNALSDGHTVTVAARDPAAIAAANPLPAAARVIATDVRDAASVVRAMQGHDAGILAVSTPARKPDSLYSSAARNIVEGAAKTELSRLVAISSGGVRQDDPALPFWYRKFLIPFVMKDLYDDMGEMEAAIRASALDWTIVRASYLRDEPARSSYRAMDGATPRGGWKLARADLARFTTDQLRDGRWSRRTPTLAE